MKSLIKIQTTTLILLGCFFTSCNNREKAGKEYVQCIIDGVTDTIIESGMIKNIETPCYNSIIIDKYKLNDDETFSEKGLKCISSVNVLDSTLNVRLKKNIKNVLTNRKGWVGLSAVNSSYWERTVLNFEGKMFKGDIQRCSDVFTGNWIDIEESFSGTYSLENESDGIIYLVLIFDKGGEKETYIMKKNEKSKIILDGKITFEEVTN